MKITPRSSQRAATRNRGRRGNAIVEFAFAFVLFLTLVVSLFDFGRLAWTYTAVHYASRQASRYATVHSAIDPTSSGELLTIARTHAIGLDPALLTITTNYNPATVKRGSLLTVRLNYPFNFAFGALVPQSTIPLQSTSMVVVASR
ncbi:MAG: pilus assembly protein [Acidobacteria bacterium]|nr:pilus assembly protein [Acidobacteriota bacterium]